jgi:hypothetical protein
MSEDDHKVCELQKHVAVLEQKAADAAIALVLARDVATARWTSIIAIVISLLGIAVSLIKH